VKAINAKNCATYLRSIGIDVDDAKEREWIATERDTRRRLRVHAAELKRTCGHFRPWDTIVYTTRGTFVDTHCLDCRRPLGSRPYKPATLPIA
jgi:hypothetical protein